jgi:uncharacterized protein YfaS (alpha-2-macroglobulin family)
MPLRFDQSLDNNQGGLRHYWPYLLVFVLLLVSSACSFPSGETETPTPSPSQEIVERATATIPAIPTPTPRPLPPDLVESEPFPNSEVGLDGSVIFYFNQAMDQTSVEAAFSGLSGRINWVDDSTLIYTPNQPLTPAAQLNLQFDTQAQAANGLPLVEPINLVYRAVGYLNLAQSLPEDGSTAVEPSSAIVATFNRPVVPLGGDQDTLPPAFTLEPNAEGRGEWINTSSFVFSPEPSLAGGTEYTVRLNSDLTGVDGSPLEIQQAWSFTTAVPKLMSVEPIDGTNNVRLDSDVILTFNQPMDPDSIVDEFRLLEAKNTRIRGEFTWNDDNTEFIFTPDNLLKRDRVYSISLSEKTLSGGGTQIGSENQSTFQTIPELAVIRSDPGDNGQKEIYSSIAIEFNSPIKFKNALQFITLNPQVSDLEAFVDEEERTIWLSGYYEPDTAYTLTISPNLPDKWNSRLGQEFILNFRNKPFDPSLMVATGSDVIFLTPEQSSITVQVTNLSDITYSLGEVPLEDFQQLIAPGNYEIRQTYHPERELTLLRNLEIPANQSTPVEIPLSLDGGPLAPGIYSIRFSADIDYIYPGPYLLIVSDINTTLKLSATDVLAWAVNLTDGSAVGNIPVTVYSERGDALARGETDAEGVFHSDIPIREMEDIYGISYAILGEPGKETFSAALSNWGQGLNGGDFGYRVDYTPPHLEAYLYTDRPIYRPGQSVNFKAILRQAYNGRYDLPDQSNLILNLFDDFGEQIATLDLPLSEFGTAHGLYTLPEDTEPGTYRFTSEEAYYSSVAFQVAEYRKPEIDVSVSFPSDQTLAGEKITGIVSANYFFGAPAGSVPVSWTLFRSPENFYLPGYQVGKPDTRWLSGIPSFIPFGFQEQVSQGEGQTDPSGNFDIERVIPRSDERYRYTLEATVMDESGLPVSARSDVMVNPDEFFIGVRPDAWSGRAGSETGFEVQVVDWDQEPAGEQPLLAEYSKVVWERIDPQPGDLRGFPTYEPHYTLVGSTDFLTGKDGKARIAFIPPEPGTYQLQVSGRGLPGENAVTETILWVGGPGQAVWPTLPNQRLRLTADKDSYQPNETAQVFVPNPLGEGAIALVTIERGVLFEHQVLQVKGSGVEIPVLLTDEQAPNIYLSATLIKPNGEGDPDFRQGYLVLPVEPVEQSLNVSLVSDPVVVEPGGKITMNLLVTDAQGNPVQGEFSISVVDLAVLALANPNSLDIVPAFYGEQPLGVSTSLSLAASTQLRLYLTEGIGGGGGGEPASPIQVREEFLDTAYWNAAIVTDAEGQAQVTLTLPDNITTWQLDTRGVTSNTQVGQDNGLVVSTKELLVRPVTPRFFVVGDHAVVAAVIHNNSTDELQVDVSLQESGFEMDDPKLAHQEVRIPPGGRERVEWWGTAEDVESVDLVFAADAGTLQDASRPAWGDLPVLRYIAPQTFGTSGIIDDGGERLELVSLPRSFDPGGGELRLEMAPTLGAAMMSALEVLEYYPYSNTEQSVSRFLPNLETYRVIQEFGLEEPGLQARLERTLEDSIAQLNVRQNPDGGWGWWKGDQSDTYITAYVLFGLIRAQDAGIEIDPLVIESAINYLTASLPTMDMLTETWQYDRLAFVHYVLSQAGEGDLVGVSRLYNERSQLNPWAQALLALTLENISPGDERIQTLYSDLERNAIRTATGAHWENRESSWQNMSTTIQSTAVVLYALTNHDPASPLVADALRYLMAHRSAMGAWASTYETSWTLMALAEVMQGTGELSGEFDFSAALNDTPLVAGEASGTSQLTPVETKVPISSMYPSEPNSLIIQRGEGMGRLYYNTHLSVYQPVEEVAPLNKGINITRAYFSSDGDCLDEDCPSIGQAQSGELVTVRLTLTIPETTYYLLVEDYFPAGAEVLDISLKTSQSSAEQQYNPHAPFDQGWGWWYFSDPQVYDDRVSWAVDTLPAGTYELTYQFVTVQPGEYRIIPARAYQSYFPEVQGNSAGDIFEIKE